MDASIYTVDSNEIPHRVTRFTKLAIPKLVLVRGCLSLSVCCSVSKSQIVFLERNQF